MSACEAFMATSRFSCLFCCDSKRRRMKSKLLDKGIARLDKSLDVVNFVKRMELANGLSKLIFDKPTRSMFKN
jgi:hypothetical protein